MIILKSWGNCIFYLAFLLTFSNVPLYSQVENTKANVLFTEGMKLLDQENLLSALQQFESARNINPHFSSAYFGLSQGYFLLNEFDEAQENIERAIELAPNKNDYKNHLGRVLLAQGKIEQADRLFTQILSQDPFNRDALLGKGELLLAEGNITQAQSLFLDTLSVHPNDRRVLLSLTLVLEAAGRRAEAERYLNRALDIFSENSTVQYLAGQFYADRGEYQTALSHLTTTLDINPRMPDALHLNAQIFIQLQRYSQALPLIDQALQIVPEESTYWYTRGLVQFRLREIDHAIESLLRGLTIAPYNEFIRLFLESIAIDHLEYSDEVRLLLGRYRENQAKQYFQQNRYGRAAVYLQRAVSLIPVDVEVRLTRADLLLSMGRQAAYVEELSFLVNDLGRPERELKDALEVYSNLLINSVAESWNIDQFSVSHDYIIMPIFYRTKPSVHPEASDFLSLTLSDILLAGNRFSLSPDPEIEGRFLRPREVADVEDAFRQARELSSDYFLLIDFQENERDILLSAQLFLSRTGRLVWKDSIVRTGNTRVMDGLIWLNNKLTESLPFRGTLIKRDLDTGLINLGQYDGITPGDELQILSPSQVIIATNGTHYSIDEAGVQGSITINRVDARISEGKLNQDSFFDTINTGDAVIYPKFLAKKTSQEIEDSAGNFPFIYSRIRQLR